MDLFNSVCSISFQNCRLSSYHRQNFGVQLLFKLRNKIFTLLNSHNSLLMYVQYYITICQLPNSLWLRSKVGCFSEQNGHPCLRVRAAQFPGMGWRYPGHREYGPNPQAGASWAPHDEPCWGRKIDSGRRRGVKSVPEKWGVLSTQKRVRKQKTEVTGWYGGS